MILINTVPELQDFVRNVLAKAKHHAKYALPIFGPLLTAVLAHADTGQFGSTKNHSGGAGVQIRFAYRGRWFKALATGKAEQTIVLREILGNTEGPVLVEWDEFTLAEDIEPEFLTALRNATRKKTAAA